MGKSKREEIYAKAGYGGKVGFGKRPAIVIVDWQKQHTDPRTTTSSDFSVQVTNTRRMTDAAREKNIPVIYSRCIYKKDNVDLGVWGDKIPGLIPITADNWDTGLDEKLDVRENDHFIDKHWPSSFFGTYVASILNSMHIDTVVVCGCTVGGCVYATVVDSCSYGFRTIIPRDAVGDRTVETFEDWMFIMDQQYGDASTTDEVLEYFKTVEPLEFEFLN